jgi:chemotaxis protein CheD
MMREARTKLHLIQGEHRVVNDADTVLSTILGSCVAACLRDPLAGVGGMNHFLLPGRSDSNEGVQYGAYAMEVLINALLKRGARRDRLEAKLFGGARMVQGLTDIGSQNAQFARTFLEHEGIAYLGGSLGGSSARRLLYWPVSGVAHQHRLAEQNAKIPREQTAPPPFDGEVELFAA